MKYLVVLSLIAMCLFRESSHAASNSREFVMSCTYGVLAGTLVGAATLAFESQPGDKLYKVARGASLGLYAGIALGLYVVYGVSDGEEMPEMYDEPGYLPSEGQIQIPRSLPVVVAPLLNEKEHWDGLAAHFRVLEF